MNELEKQMAVLDRLEAFFWRYFVIAPACYVLLLIAAMLLYPAAVPWMAKVGIAWLVAFALSPVGVAVYFFRSNG